RAEKVAGQPIRDLVTVNGVRVTLADGTWGLVRASSNKPELVVVVESPVSEARMRDMFKAVDGVLRTHREVGAYNQTIWRREAVSRGCERPARCCGSRAVFCPYRCAPAEPRSARSLSARACPCAESGSSVSARASAAANARSTAWRPERW